MSSQINCWLLVLQDDGTVHTYTTLSLPSLQHKIIPFQVNHGSHFSLAQRLTQSLFHPSGGGVCVWCVCWGGASSVAEQIWRKTLCFPRDERNTEGHLNVRAGMLAKGAKCWFAAVIVLFSVLCSLRWALSSLKDEVKGEKLPKTYSTIKSMSSISTC